MKATYNCRDKYWKTAAERWHHQEKTTDNVYNELLNAKSADDVDIIIGNTGWTSVNCCCCNTNVVEWVNIDIPHTNHLHICLSCFIKFMNNADKLLDTHTKVERVMGVRIDTSICSICGERNCSHLGYPDEKLVTMIKGEGTRKYSMGYLVDDTCACDKKLLPSLPSFLASQILSSPEPADQLAHLGVPDCKGKNE